MQRKILTTLVACAMGTTAWAETSTDSSEKLDDIIVTATRSQIATTEAPGSVSVITRQEIEQKGQTSIVDLIRGTTGVSLRGIGTGGRKVISLRGMESRHTLIMVDGKRIPSSNDSLGPNTDYQFDWIPVENIERIEVVRGPMSVLYGADALGGVVNIITRPAAKKARASVKASGNLSGVNGHDISLALNGPLSQKFQVGFTAQEGRRASLPSILKTGQSALEGRNKQSATLNLDMQPANSQNIHFEITQGNEDRWYDTKTRKGVLYQSQYDIDREQISLGWKGHIGKTSNHLRTYQTTIDISNKASNGVKATAPQQLTETVLEGNSAFSVGQKHYLTAGFESRNEKLKNSRLKGGKGDVTLNSLYLQDEIDATDNLVFTLGGRLDDHEVFGHEFSPRASLVWNATERLTLKGSYGHGFRAPNIKQSSADYVFSFGPFKVTGNPDLKPETNNALELGLNYRTEKLNLDASVFDNKVKNLIELTGPISDRTYQNVSKARLKGLELSSDVYLLDDLSLKTAYQYLDAKDDNGERLKHRPRHTLSAGISWDNADLKWNLGAEYVSGQIIEHNNVSTRVPGYAIWNAGIQKPLSKQVDLALHLNNITDVRLEEKSPAFLHEEYPRTLILEIKGSF